MKATDQIEFKVFDKAEVKLKEFEQKHRWIDCLIAPVIVTIILLSVYAVKGVYPFGWNTIAYYDMPTQYVPFYTNAWDVVHGREGLFLCWYYGLGVSTVAGLVNFVIFPTNAFLFFTSRDKILYVLSFVLILKMALSALSMSFYCKKKHGDLTWTICAGVLYACSGYVIQYYTNLFFLDYVILFPMIVWSFEKLMNDHKYRMFIFFLFLAMIPNFQFAAMVVIYLLIKAYFVLETIPADKRGRSLRLFAFSGIIAVLLSAFLMIPALVLTLESSRMELNEEFSYIEALKSVFCYFRKEKQFMMYGGEIAVGLALIILFKGKATVKKYWTNIAMIIVMGLPILIEGINLLWHFGSYKHFPVRFGYMLTFELLIFVGEYIKNRDMFDVNIIGRAAKLISISSIPFIAYVLFAFFKQFLHSAITDRSSYESYKIYFLTLSVSFFVIFLINEKRTRSIILIALVLVQAFCGCYGLIAPEIGFADGARLKYLLKTFESRNDFEGDASDKTHRVKSELLNYEPNYGPILEQSSVGIWAYSIPADTESMLLKSMKYQGAQSVVTDEGGTVFSDSLLGVTRLLSENVDDDILYRKIDGKERLYETVYKMPFGIVVENSEIETDSTSFEFNNILFEKITGLTNKLIEIKSAGKYVTENNELSENQTKEIRKRFIDNVPLSNTINGVISEETSKDAEENLLEVNALSETGIEDENHEQAEPITMNEYVLTIPVNGKKSVYLDVEDDFVGELAMILNGKCMFFSSFLAENSNTYPNTIYRGIISLGSYENSGAELKIYTSNKNLDGVNIGLLDLNILGNGIEKVEKSQKLNVECGKDVMNVSGNVSKDGTLFFPVGYSRDWSVKVNGEKAEVKPYVNGAFISVDVKEGDVNISFKYRPKGLLLGWLLTFFGICALLSINYIVKRGGIKGKKYESIVDRVVLCGFKVLAYVILIIMYVIPICVKLSL